MAAALPAISIGSTIAGGALGVYGSIFGGEAKANAANYQAGIAQMNAQVAQQNAAYESARGEYEAERSGMKARAEIGQTRAIQAASGVDVNRGSTVDVRTSMAQLGSLSEASIRNTAARKAFGFEVESAGDEAQSALDRMAASTAKTEGTIGAMSSLLSAAGGVSDKWLKYSSTFGNSSGGGGGGTTMGVES